MPLNVCSARSFTINMRPSFRDIAAALSRGHVPKVDFHLHTTWTDGSNAAHEMLEAANRGGLEAILFSEHARSSSGDWFPRFAAEVRGLKAARDIAFVGAEVKIASYDGALDICDVVRNECDLIMASVHRFPEEIHVDKACRPALSREEATGKEFELSVAALRSGGFDILGHPFGMSYRRFGYAPPKALVFEVIRECARANVAFEINAQYHPDPWALVRQCVDCGAPISLGSNAHQTSHVGRVQRILEGNEAPWQPSELS
jgi:putative hydrolase